MRFVFLCRQSCFCGKEKSNVRELVQKELDQGYTMRIEGGLPALQQRFPPGDLAIGRPGVVTAKRKEDRLIGDSRARTVVCC